MEITRRLIRPGRDRRVYMRAGWEPSCGTWSVLDIAEEQ